jgi:glutamate-1-semialdehyde 2,1-aminomutase
MFDVTRTIQSAASEAVYREAVKHSSLGVQGANKFTGPYPIYFTRGQRARVWDADGNEYIDVASCLGSNILGHAHPELVEALTATLRDEGMFIGNPTVKEVELARVFCEIIPCADEVYFTGGGGSDPIFFAIRGAKALTGRRKILKHEGSYHGWTDPVLMSVLPDPRLAGPAEAPVPVPDSLGIPQDVVDSTLVTTANDEAMLERVVTRHRDEIAAIIVEPVMHSMGVVPLRPGYLRLLRQLCDTHGIVLIFDEILTGFRHDLGGAQRMLGVTPDMAVFGKAMTNGHAIMAALAGRREFMKLFPEKAKVTGTFIASLFGTTAALKTIEILKRDDGAFYRHVYRLGDMARDGLNRAAREVGVNVRCHSLGSTWCLYPTTADIHNYRDLLAAVDFDRARAFASGYRTWLLNHGIFSMQGRVRAHLTAAHTEEDVERIVDVSRKFFMEFRSELK